MIKGIESTLIITGYLVIIAFYCFYYYPLSFLLLLCSLDTIRVVLTTVFIVSRYDRKGWVNQILKAPSFGKCDFPVSTRLQALIYSCSQHFITAMGIALQHQCRNGFKVSQKIPPAKLRSKSTPKFWFPVLVSRRLCCVTICFRTTVDYIDLQAINLYKLAKNFGSDNMQV